MAGRQGIRAQFLRGGKQIGEFYRLVAGHAGDRRFAHGIGFGKGVDHGFTEPRFVIQHVMGDTERFADPARIVDILPGATGAGAVHSRTVVVKLEGNAEDIIALALEDTGHHGRIDATGHGDNDPGIFRPLVKIERIHVFSHRQS
ncbi:hypothetical protein D3C71_975200 [compost metagenome]